MIPLFKRYPKLRTALAHLPLGTFPTPVEPLTHLSGTLGRSKLYIKRDDLSGVPYGGNKIRKLEFLLADAKKTGATRIITSGAAGSNHALATAIYSRQCGFNCTLMLFTQPSDPAIPRQLLADFATGAELLHDDTYPDHLRHLGMITSHYAGTEGIPPYVIPAGGSSITGAVGFVNAAFELADQIGQGRLPEPHAIYVTLGTMGTAAGLLVGLAAAGIKSRLVAVRVVPDVVADRLRLVTFFRNVNDFLCTGDPGFPRLILDDAVLSVRENYFGKGYGVPTTAGTAAMNTFKQTDAMVLDPVYTGKTGAAFLDDASSAALRNKPLLFWHTKSALPAPQPPQPVDYKKLPGSFHHYFRGYR